MRCHVPDRPFGFRKCDLPDVTNPHWITFRRARPLRDLSPQGLGITPASDMNEGRQVGVIVDGGDEALDTVSAAVERQPGAVFGSLARHSAS